MKPSIPQGTRDFSPIDVRKRQVIFKTLQSIFELYGFQPLETPAMENLVTLTGKYGEEGDRLIFKILNNGLHEKKETDKEKLSLEWQKMLQQPYATPVVTERALRYDLTIPFARYVAMNQNDIALPFKRYQMQPVWRADRPQRGRYREFWQCDCDVVGSNSLINEAELISIYQAAFHALNIPQVEIKINSRKLLAGLAEIAGVPDLMIEMTVALDKLDKIGWDGVEKELTQSGINEQGIATIKILISIEGSNENKIAALKLAMQNSTIGLTGIEEVEQTFSYLKTLSKEDWQSSVVLDLSLARGLNYYTGIIVEVTTSSVKMGSIGGGGRYDDLTSLFGVKGISGVGISFGIDRIYDVLEELNLFPAQLNGGAQVMIINFGKELELYGLQILHKLRQYGISAEIYPDASKFDKQMKYANKRSFSFVIIPGEEEFQKAMLSLKNFETGNQQVITLDQAVSILKAH